MKKLLASKRSLLTIACLAVLASIGMYLAFAPTQTGAIPHPRDCPLGQDKTTAYYLGWPSVDQVGERWESGCSSDSYFWGYQTQWQDVSCSPCSN